jgi:hypothetical protein
MKIRSLYIFVVVLILCIITVVFIVKNSRYKEVINMPVSTEENVRDDKQTKNNGVALFYVDPEAVSEVHLFHGITGRHISITDREQIDLIINDINEFRYNKKECVYKIDPTKGEGFPPGRKDGMSIRIIDESKNIISAFRTAINPFNILDSEHNFIEVDFENEIIQYTSSDQLKINYVYFRKYFE